jgi:TonB family protein
MNPLRRSSIMLVALWLGAGSGSAWAAKPKKLAVVRAFASSSADKQPPEHAIDGKLDRLRWGANGDGATLTLDLGKACTVSAVRVAAPPVDDRPRVAAFEIQVSGDDVAYRTVFTGESDKRPLELDNIVFPPAAARYVRYRGHANTHNSWTVLAELEAWGVCDEGASAEAPPADETFEPPRLVESVPPIEYAARAKDLGWSGLLVFCATVDDTGRVSSTRIIQAPAGPYAGWKDVVAASVSHWKFEPAQRGGKPVKAFYEGTVVMSQAPDEEKAIGELFARFGAAWDAKDVPSLVALLHPMKRRLYAAGELPPDPEAATAWLTKHFAGPDIRPLRGLRVDAIDLQPFGDAGSLAGQLAYCELSFERPGPTRLEAGTFSAMLLKSTDGGWRILSAAVPPAPAIPDRDTERPLRGATATDRGRQAVPATLVQAVFRDGQVVDTEVLIDNPDVKDVPKHILSHRPMDPGSRPLLLTMVVREPEPPRSSGRIKPPQLIKHVKPEYPPAAMSVGIKGVVILSLTVTADGDVTNVRVLKGNAALNDAAIQAVSQWKYTPGLRDGTPAPIPMTITVRFDID